MHDKKMKLDPEKMAAKMELAKELRKMGLAAMRKAIGDAEKAGDKSDGMAIMIAKKEEGVMPDSDEAEKMEVEEDDAEMESEPALSEDVEMQIAELERKLQELRAKKA